MANVAYIFRSSYVTMIKRLMIMILTDIDDSQLGKLVQASNDKLNFNCMYNWSFSQNFSKSPFVSYAYFSVDGDLHNTLPAI